MSLRAKQSLKRCGLFILLLCIFLAAYVYFHTSSSAPIYQIGREQLELPHRLRTMDEHDVARRRNGGNPYILELNSAGGALLYYGASHTRDPDHPQISDITKRWDEFEPTVALCEGRSRRHVWGMLIEPFAGLPEPALVHKLARRDRVKMHSLEPSYESEVAALNEQFDPRHVAMYYFLRVYASESRGAANDRLAMSLLAKRTNVEGLRGVLGDLSAVDAVWAELRVDPSSDWRTQTGEPIFGIFGRISTASREYRGRHMIYAIADLMRKGERVFAVVGSGHVIRQEWNLRELFDATPAWDQPTLLQVEP